ncbi:MAG: DUF2252 domain-containing protein [Nocardioidaceae bacterium]|nr:DUF2252 domain-containing protein [Nocardioidaceae bacterium]
MTAVGSRPLSRADRVAVGRRARRLLPPGEQGELAPPPDRQDPVAAALEQARTRVPELVPIRHRRMAASPFTFLRGNARGMAGDLAGSPVSGLSAQLCGDAHLSNFGLFGSAERRLLFDLNDFDETHPGPWEWDLRRLAASIVVAGRENGFSRKKRRRAVRRTVRRYRDAMAEFATVSAHDVWYAGLDADELRALASPRLTGKQRGQVDKALAKARASDRMKAFAQLVEVVDGRLRIKADPPLVMPLDALLGDADRDEVMRFVEALLHQYGRTLPSERRVLLQRYELVDLAHKVVGVGSVGTRCWVVLLRGVDDADPLFLQVKEAGPSVLAGLVPPAMVPAESPTNQGERVVHGQRLMQAAGDIFLGWHRAVGFDGPTRDFYVRQLRDMKGSADIESMTPDVMVQYGELCGWTLARAHARSGDPIAIAAYVGDDDVLPDAMVRFAEAYADLNERDHAEFAEAVADGRLPAAPPG